jgi:hypothetical protein
LLSTRFTAELSRTQPNELIEVVSKQTIEKYDKLYLFRACTSEQAERSVLMRKQQLVGVVDIV